ncbi:carboxylesterase 4A-like [Tetranychus urticae]|uniref:Carboxylic ester hydrolase n=1 Tax=Tetranychus urticae TaxID=32264 RepID=T1JTH6_TETUR|nr:carboxylesterase 4A-like [Tetranychus urticae]
MFSCNLIVAVIFTVILCNEIKCETSFKSTEVTENPVIETKLGLIQGNLRNESGFVFEEFLGIKYATVPKRFKYSTLLNQRWDGILKANEYGPICPQQDAKLATSEDCLYLNVWRPTGLSDETLLPVLFWVHGSGWRHGSGAGNPGGILAADGKIIVVTINYRLGALGFGFGDENEIQGNQGISDAINGLKWVRENIGCFGGDPSQVTLAGHSAGSMLGSIIPVMPTLDHSLYSKLWLMSGVSTITKIIENTTIALAKTKLLASKVGCGSVTPGPLAPEVIECLQNVNVSILIDRNQDEDIRVIGGAEGPAFLPVYGTPLVPAPVIDLFLSSYGKIEKKIIFNGVHQDEATPWIGNLSLNTRDEAYAGAWFKLSYIKKDLTAEQMKPFFDYYFNGIQDGDTKSFRVALAKFVTDLSFRCPSICLSEIFSTYHSVRFGEYTYISDKDGPQARPDGPQHGDSIPLYFGQPFASNPTRRRTGSYSGKDKNLSLRLMKTMSDFVYGVEPLDWPELHFDKKNPEKKPKIKIINLTDSIVEFDDQSLCFKWAKLLNFEITSNSTSLY